MGTDTATSEAVVLFHFCSAIILCVFTGFNLESLREGEMLCKTEFALNFYHISIKCHNTCKHTSLYLSVPKGGLNEEMLLWLFFHLRTTCKYELMSSNKSPVISPIKCMCCVDFPDQAVFQMEHLDTQVLCHILYLPFDIQKIFS